MSKNSNKIPKKIQLLMDKYYSGLSTIEEERELKHFFKSKNSIVEGDIFNYSNIEKLSTIDEHEIWNNIKIRTNDRQNKVKKLIYISSIAASLILVLTLGILKIDHNLINNQNLADSYTNPDEAYIIAKKYLTLISTKLNYGYTEIRPIRKISIPIEYINNITELEKGYNNLSRIGVLAEQSNSLKYVSVFNDYINVE